MEQLGCSATEALIGWSIGGYSVIVLAFIFSTIILKKGVRLVATISLIISAAAIIMVGVGYNMKSLAVLTIGGFVLKNFLQAVTLSIFQVVARWFGKSRGMVLGFIGAAFALDNSSSSTGMTLIYNSVGFAGLMVVAAIIVLVIAVCFFTFVRTTPEELGLTVDGLPSAQAVENNDREQEQPESKWTFNKLFSKKETWCIMVGVGIFNMTMSCVVTQFFGSLLGMGVTQQMCMTYMLIFGLLGVVMSPIYGKLVDKLGAPKTGVVAAVLYIAAVSGFCFNIPVLGATGLTFFVGAPVLQPAIIMHVFGGREYQATSRYINIGASVISACGLPFMTMFYDATGSYTPAYYTLLVLNFVALLMMLFCRKTYIEE
jgi:predicted MFS family arabinose efflux permease